MSSDALLDAPLEGADAEHGVVVVGLFETLEQGGSLLVLDDGEDGAVHGRPCVAAQMRVAGLGAAAADLFEEGVTAYVCAAQHGQHVLFLCLVKGDEDGFHI